MGEKRYNFLYGFFISLFIHFWIFLDSAQTFEGFFGAMAQCTRNYATMCLFGAECTKLWVSAVYPLVLLPHWDPPKTHLPSPYGGVTPPIPKITLRASFLWQERYSCFACRCIVDKFYFHEQISDLNARSIRLIRLSSLMRGCAVRGHDSVCDGL